MANIHEQRKRCLSAQARTKAVQKMLQLRGNYLKLVHTYVKGETWGIVVDPMDSKKLAKALNYRGITFTMTHSGCSGNVKVFFCQKTAERYLRDNPFYFDPHNRDRKLYSIVACNDPYIRENYLVAVQSGEHQYGIIV